MSSPSHSPSYASATTAIDEDLVKRINAALAQNGEREM